MVHRPQPLSVEITGPSCLAEEVHLLSEELSHVNLVRMIPLQGYWGTLLETYGSRTPWKLLIFLVPLIPVEEN